MKTATAKKMLALGALIAVALAGGLMRASGRASAAAPLKPAPAEPADLGPYPALAVTGDLDTGRAAARAAREPISAVYTAEADIAVWSAATGVSYPITDDGEEGWEWRPLFIDANTISFQSQKGIEIVDTDGGNRSVVVEAGEFPPIVSGWSPNGRMVAYLTIKVLGEGFAYQPILHLRNRDDGRTIDTPLDALMPEGGCGVGGDSEQEIAFSSDGSLIMVEDTAFQDGKTVFFLDDRGRPVGRPLNAMYPRWIPGSDNQVLLFDLKKEEWIRYTPATGARAPSSLPDAARRPSFSPNGTRVAFDKGAASGGLYVMDLLEGSVHRIGRGHAGPVWLSDTMIVAAKMDRCLDCQDDVWHESGRTSLFRYTGRVGSLPMTSTVSMDVLVR